MKDINMNNTNESLNRNPFTVPEGYFDQLEANVRRKTETSAPQVVRWLPASLKLAGIAALLAIGTYMVIPKAPAAGAHEMLADVGTQHLEAYLAEQEGLYSDDILLPASLSDELATELYLSTDSIF